MDELTSDFVAETRDMLEHVSEALVAWEAQPADHSRLDEIFRFVHTVKGSCGFLKLPRIEALAHAAETSLASVRDGVREADARLIDTILAIVDRIALLVAALETPGSDIPPEAGDALLVEGLQGVPGPAAGAETGDVAPTRPTRSVRIAVSLLEAMMNQVSELVLVRNEMSRGLKQSDDRELAASFERLGGIVGELRDSVTHARMQPIERLFATLPRLVRDTAHECAKDVRLEISGQGVEIDREMVEAIRDPLVHIVRNAIDHGIESREDRARSGKPATSVLRISAQQAGNQVCIEIADDGRGIDTDKLIRKAIAAKIIDGAKAATIDAAQAASLVFEAGLSTANAVTTLSGRGVGMDVVRANVERLGGRVALINRPGQGLTVTLRAPLTLSIVNALLVAAGDQFFAIPQGAIEEVLSTSQTGIRVEAIGGGLIAVVRGMAYPAFSLAKALGLREGPPHLIVMLATPAGGRFAVAVDRVLDHEELVVRPMAPQIASIGLFAGQSLGQGGVPVVVLDVAGLAAAQGIARQSDAAEPGEVAALERRPSILIATAFDGRKIGVRARYVERLIDTDRHDWVEVGDRRFLTQDGKHLAAASHGRLPDEAQIPALMLRDGDRHIVLPVAAVHDLVELGATVDVDEAGIEALARLGEDNVLLLDVDRLLDETSPVIGTWTRRAA